jgi:protein-S-isoprenylcysteine O-methyltransferase
MTISHLFMALYWIWFALEMLLQIVTRTTRSTGQIKDRGSLLLMLPSIFLAIWLATWYGETHARSMFGGAMWLKPVGLALFVTGLVIRCTAIFTLGTSFSTNVAIHATQSLKTHGLYKWVRHPSYTGMLVIFFAVGVYERNWVSLAIILLVPIPALLYRIHVEEAALTEAFGPQYTEYSRSTSRLIPGVY